MKHLKITLKKKVANFCMSRGETIEFKNGGFRRLDWPVDKPFFPNFGPYVQLNEIAEKMANGDRNPEMHKLFDVEIQ